MKNLNLLYSQLFFFTLPDIVYIGTLTPNHAEQSKLMLRSGKHVLCEKPMAMNLRQVDEVLAVAKEQKKFFMEVCTVSTQDML